MDMEQNFNDPNPPLLVSTCDYCMRNYYPKLKNETKTLKLLNYWLMISSSLA